MTTATQADAVHSAVRPTHPLADAWVFTQRSVRHSFRQIDGLLMSVMLPVMMLLLFVYVFGGAIGGTSHLDYLHYVVPGIILLSGGYGASLAAMSVNHDMTTGTIDRIRSMPTPVWTLLTGHVVAALLRNLLSTVLVVGVGMLIGFRPTADAVSWAAALGVVCLYILAIAWVAVVFGVLASSPDSATGFTFVVLFLPYISSAFVPPDTLPAVLQGVAANQPVTPAIETVRALLLDQPVGDHGWIAVAWCVGIMVVAIPAAAAVFRRRTHR